LFISIICLGIKKLRVGEFLHSTRVIAAIQNSTLVLLVMPDLIRHPEACCAEKALDSPSTLLRVVSLSNHGSSPE